MKYFAILFAFAFGSLINHGLAAEEISAILKQIKAERTGQIPKPTPAPYTPPQKKQEQKKKSSATPGMSSKAKKPSAPKVPIWSPRDKLPKDVTGHYLAGTFAVQGEDLSGCATLIPVQDANNPFARQFNVVNMSTGLAPGTLVPIGRREMVTVPRSRPLVFIGRGLLPGIYQVQAQ
jgi:hypothetical protein